MSMDGGSYTPGKGGWSGREGHPPGSSEIVVRLTLRGGDTDSGGCACQLGNNHWGTPVDIPVQAFPAKAGRRGRLVSDNERDVAGNGIARLPVSTPEMGCPARKMRPAVVDGTTPPQPKVELSGVRESVVGRPLSVGAPEFSPKMGTEALQSCLPHQLDLHTGQLWAAGRSTLQLHQQRLIPEVDGFLTTSVVLPPDSEIVAPFSVSGVQPNCCALVEPSRTLTEEYGVIVGHTLVDASSWTMVNPNAEEVVLPSFTCVGKLVPVSAISVALADPGLPIEDHAILPEHLDDIVRGSHPSLSDSGRQLHSLPPLSI